MSRKPGAISPAQCRAARALLEWTQQGLADAAQVSRATIRDFELGKHDCHRSTEALIRQAFEGRGIRFVLDPALGEGLFWRPPADQA